MSTPTTPPQLSQPSFFNLLLESRAPFEFASLVLHLNALKSVPRGSGKTVLLVPGYMADDHSMRPLGYYLSHLGYDVHYAELGRNRGHVEEDIVRLQNRTTALSKHLDNKAIALIGWSLGGVLAREVTRLLPTTVSEVITFGTPIVGGPKFTALGARYIKERNIDIEEMELDIHQRNQLGFEQPVTSIYSKTDGIVSWEASVDCYNAQAKNVEVTGSHLGLGLNHDVWQLVAYTLADNTKATQAQ
jgi:hypothetical protein